MDREALKRTAEWQALNRIWQTMTREQRAGVQGEFKTLSALIQRLGEPQPTPMPKAVSAHQGYLEELSPEARDFLRQLAQEGEPNLYHSFQAVIEGGVFESPREVADYYYLKYQRKRPYLVEKRPLVMEILEVCWRRTGGGEGT